MRNSKLDYDIQLDRRDRTGEQSKRTLLFVLSSFRLDFEFDFIIDGGLLILRRWLAPVRQHSLYEDVTCWYSALRYDWDSRNNHAGRKTHIKSYVLLSASANSITSIPSSVYLSQLISEEEINQWEWTDQCRKARRLNIAVNLKVVELVGNLEHEMTSRLTVSRVRVKISWMDVEFARAVAAYILLVFKLYLGYR